MVGRLLFADQIDSIEGLGNQADAAYAMTALNLLPPGFVGLIVSIAMLAGDNELDGLIPHGDGRHLGQEYLYACDAGFGESATRRSRSDFR